MSTAELKNYLVKLIIDIEDESLLEKVKSYVSTLVTGKDVDWWDTISEDEKASIEKGIEQADKGQLTPHDEVMKKYKKWL